MKQTLLKNFLCYNTHESFSARVGILFFFYSYIYNYKNLKNFFSSSKITKIILKLDSCFDSIYDFRFKIKKKKSNPADSKSEKAKKKLKQEKREQKQRKNIIGSNELKMKSLLEEIEKLSSETSPENLERREEYERQLAFLEKEIEKEERLKNFWAQIKEDVLKIHLASDNYICLCFKGEKESWRQIFVPSKNLEKKLTELCSDPDFDSKNIYISQAKFLSDRSRAIDNVASYR